MLHRGARRAGHITETQRRKETAKSSSGHARKPTITGRAAGVGEARQQ